VARVENIQFSEASDVAVCALHFEKHIPEHIRFQKKITIDTTPVDENIAIAAIGYFGMVSKWEITEAGSEISLHSKFDFRKGTIVRRYGSRGPGIHKWPCFQCNIAFDHGMSGGPVVYYRPDETIVACGMISSDFSFQPSEDQPTEQRGTACMLWPAMSLSLPNTAINGVACEPSLLELQSQGFIEDFVNASQHIKQTVFDEDGQSVTRYVWE
jgi:hypothetical protein